MNSLCCRSTTTESPLPLLVPPISDFVILQPCYSSLLCVQGHCNMAIVRAASRALPTFRLLCCGHHLLSHFDSTTVRTVRQVDKLAFGRGDLKNHGTSTDLLGHNVRRCYSAQATHQSIEAAPVPPDYQTYVDRVKARLETERADLPVGKNGRDDEDLLLWFLRDRNFDVDAAVAKLVEALEWRREFGVGEITEASVSKVASIGEAYVHIYPAKDGRPVIIVISSKQYPNDERLIETRQKHCVYLIEKALTQLSPGGETFLGIFDLRGFQPKNGDLKFVNFLIDVFFKYYPKRLGQVLFVDAPFIFQPGWRMVKPLFGKYAALVQFCSADDVRNDYFTPDTVPEIFKH